MLLSKKILIYFSLTLFYFFAFIYNYADRYAWPLDHMPSQGDIILNFTQTVHSAKVLLSGEWTNFWDLGQFFPFKNTKSLSDHQLFPGILLAVFNYIGIGWVKGFNLIIIIFYCLNGLCFYAFCRYLKFNVPVSFLCSTLFAVNHYRTVHFEHFQLLATFWYPLLFISLLSYWKDFNIKAIIYTLLCLLGLASCSPYLFVFVIPFMLIVAAIFSVKEIKNFDLKRCLSIVVLSTVFVTILLSFYAPYEAAKVFFGLERFDHERNLYSFVNRGFNANSLLKYSDFFLETRGSHSEANSYIPIVWRVLFILGLGSLFIPLKRIKIEKNIKAILFCLSLFVLYTLFSYGPNGALGLSPWSLLSKISAFSGIRSPGRMMIFSQIMLLIATGLMLNGFGNYFKKTSAVLSVIFSILLILELTPLQGKTNKFDFEIYEKIANAVEKDANTEGKIPGVFFPIQADHHFQALIAASKVHLINGRSGYTPIISEHYLYPQLYQCSNHNCLDQLKKLGTKYVFIDTVQADKKVENFFSKLDEAKFLADFGAIRTYSLINNDSLPQFDGDKDYLNYHSEIEDEKKINKTCHQNFKVRSSHNNHLLENIYDHNENKWTSGQPQDEGQWLKVVLDDEKSKHFEIIIEERIDIYADKSFHANLKSLDLLRRLNVSDLENNIMNFTNRFVLSDDHVMQQIISVYPDKTVKGIIISAKKTLWVDAFWSIYYIKICELP